MPINRNQIAKAAKNKKNTAPRILASKLKELDSVCDKHSVGKLNFNDTKLINPDGKVTWLSLDTKFRQNNNMSVNKIKPIIRGNLRANVFLFDVKDSGSSDEFIYDLVKIENDKKERDLKKDLDEIKNESTGSFVHDKLKEESLKLQQQIDKTLEPEPIQDQNQDKNKDSKLDNSQIKIEENNGSQSPNKFKKYSDKYQNKMEQKSKSLNNKYNRNLMKDLKNKFNLVKQGEYKYFEIKIDTTPMVVCDPIVYIISMPDNYEKKLYLVEGNLVMKNKVIRDIDPSYKMDDVVEEQLEHMEMIKSMEDCETKDCGYDNELVDDGIEIIDDPIIIDDSELDQ